MLGVVIFAKNLLTFLTVDTFDSRRRLRPMRRYSAGPCRWWWHGRVVLVEGRSKVRGNSSGAEDSAPEPQQHNATDRRRDAP